MAQHTALVERQPPEVAFVLSGGAALGASQVGMLRALLERNITPNLVVGTSIGSWNGLWVAAHPDLASLDKLERIWKSISLHELFGLNPINFVASRATNRPYLVPNDGMRHIFQRAAAIGDLKDITFEQLAVPLKITAANMMRGTSEVFEHGLVEPTILASSAIPGLFPPVIIDGQQYVDGGLLDNGGVSVAVEAGARQIYVMSAMYGGERTEPITNLTDLLARSSHLIAASHVQKALARYANQAEFILLEDDQSAMSNALDFHQAQTHFASGYAAAVRALDLHDKMVAARALLQEAKAPKNDWVTQWLHSPPAQAALHAVARVDVVLQKSWKQLNARVSTPR
jgi:NTE family protein